MPSAYRWTQLACDPLLPGRELPVSRWQSGLVIGHRLFGFMNDSAPALTRSPSLLDSLGINCVSVASDRFTAAACLATSTSRCWGRDQHRPLRLDTPDRLQVLILVDRTFGQGRYADDRALLRIFQLDPATQQNRVLSMCQFAASDDPSAL